MSETLQEMPEEGIDVPFYMFVLALIVFWLGMKAFFRETSQEENEEI
jgi:hypothetical protein